MPIIHLPNGPLEIDCAPGQVSDGFHSFDELYEHRCLLFLALQRAHPSLAWCSKLHADGRMFEGGWFVAGLDLPTGQVTYHLPLRLWPLATSCASERPLAPVWDGHTSAQGLDRVHAWLKSGALAG